MSVALVGAGPGDPALLTVRAAELLAEADCVIHDAPVSAAVLARVPAAAVRYNVGRGGGAAPMSQAAIGELLLACARRHQRVVRLHDGDPFVCGCGSEEAQMLAAAGIPFEIVPGVPGGIAAPAYAGIPLIHRATSASVAFIADDGRESSNIDWAAFARVETLVLDVGVQRLAEPCAALIAHGRAPETPAATIERGTLPQQRTVVGTIATQASLVAKAGLNAPVITVIGDIVRCRTYLRWFDSRPLFGRRVLVTRATERSERLAAALRALGAEPVVLPLQRFVLHAAEALAHLPGHDWLVFSSANGVAALVRALDESGRDARALAPARLAAVGPGTAEELRQHGLRPDLVAPEHHAAGLAAALRAAGGSSALLAQAAEASAELAQLLVEAGWRVTRVAAYHAEPLPVDPACIPRLDAITVASAATVERLWAAAGEDTMAAWRAAGVPLVAIGPRTAAACARLGWPATAVAEQPTPESLAMALLRVLATQATAG